MEKKNEPDFASFIRMFEPHPNSPDFKKGTIVIDFADVENNLGHILSKGGTDKKVRIDVLKSKKGMQYCVYDTYVRDKEVNGAAHSPDRQDDMPF